MKQDVNSVLRTTPAKEAWSMLTADQRPKAQRGVNIESEGGARAGWQLAERLVGVSGSCRHVKLQFIGINVGPGTKKRRQMHLTIQVEG